jgi:hypothetical protein
MVEVARLVMLTQLCYAGKYHTPLDEGLHKVSHRLKTVFYWPGACAQIKAYLRECDIC